MHFLKVILFPICFPNQKISGLPPFFKGNTLPDHEISGLTRFPNETTHHNPEILGLLPLSLWNNSSYLPKFRIFTIFFTETFLETLKIKQLKSFKTFKFYFLAKKTLPSPKRTRSFIQEYFSRAGLFKAPVGVLHLTSYVILFTIEKPIIFFSLHRGMWQN